MVEFILQRRHRHELLTDKGINAKQFRWKLWWGAGALAATYLNLFPPYNILYKSMPFILLSLFCGEMSERLKEHAWKACVCL
jgi:hypothetical protein